MVADFYPTKGPFIVYRGVGIKEKLFLVEKTILPNPEVVLQCMDTAITCEKVSFT